MSVLTTLVCGALIFCYERYYRGPSEAIFVGTWQGLLDYHGSDLYVQFAPDHTFSMFSRAWFEDAHKKPEFFTKGRWFAGGRFVYLRYSSKFRPDGPLLELWRIDDISPQELRIRYSRDGEAHVFRRVDAVATRASNQAMQLTASKPDVHAWSVCRREPILRGMHSGLAAADLVSR